ncbi:MAG: ABC-2 family transporter protein, partial [Anaerolineae bacterium]|nr:ABC-2 family transporter protein [Anaerolineae bacterium]
MKTLGLIWRYLCHNLMSAMAYRGAFVLQVFGMLLNDLMLLVFWTLLFQRFPLLNGWNLTGVVTIYAVSASGFGLVVMFFGNLTRVAHVIASGDLDYYLALPANPLWHVLASRMNLSGWGDLLFGILLYVIVVPGGWQTLPLYVLLVILVAMIFCAVGVLAGSLAFWLGQAQDLALQWFNATLSFSLYP